MGDVGDTSAIRLQALNKFVVELGDSVLDRYTYQVACQRLYSWVYCTTPLISPHHHARFIQQTFGTLKATSNRRIQAALPVICCCWAAAGGLHILLNDADWSHLLHEADVRRQSATSSSNSNGNDGAGSPKKRHHSLGIEDGGTVEEACLLSRQLDVDATLTTLSDIPASKNTLASACNRRAISDWEYISQLLVTFGDRLYPILMSLTIEEGALCPDLPLCPQLEFMTSTQDTALEYCKHMLSAQVYNNHLAEAIIGAIACSLPAERVLVIDGEQHVVEPCSTIFSAEIDTLLRKFQEFIGSRPLVQALLLAEVRSVAARDSAHPKIFSKSQAVYSSLRLPLYASLIDKSFTHNSAHNHASFCVFHRLSATCPREGVEKLYGQLYEMICNLCCAPLALQYFACQQNASSTAAEGLATTSHETPILSVNTPSPSYIQLVCTVTSAFWGVPSTADTLPKDALSPGWAVLLPAARLTPPDKLRVIHRMILQKVLPPPCAQAVIYWLMQSFLPPAAFRCSKVNPQALYPARCSVQTFELLTNIQRALDIWAAPSTLQDVDTDLQASLTRIIAACLSVAPTEACQPSSPLFVTLLSGISKRMDSTSSAIRGAGLFMAQFMSSVAPTADASVKPLDFSEDSDVRAFVLGDQDVDNIIAAAAMRREASSEALPAPIVMVQPQPEQDDTSEASANGFVEATSKGSVADDDMIEIPTISIAGYVYHGNPFVRRDAGAIKAETAMNSHSAQLARKLASRAPLSLSEALGNLKDDGATKSNAAPAPGDPSPLDAPPPFERHVASLCTLPRLIRACATSDFHRHELLGCGVPLLTTLLNLDNSFAIPDFHAWRHSALVALLAVGPVNIARETMHKLFGRQVSDGTRLEIIDVLVAAARELVGDSPVSVPQAPWELIETPGRDNVRAQHEDAIVKPSNAGAAARYISEEMFQPVLSGLLKPFGSADTGAYPAKFDSLLMGLDAEEHQPCLLKDGASSRVVAHALKACAVMLESCPLSPQRSAMTQLLLPLCYLLRMHEEADVRLGMLSGLAASLASIHKDKNLAAPSVLEHLQHAAPITCSASTSASQKPAGYVQEMGTMDRSTPSFVIVSEDTTLTEVKPFDVRSALTNALDPDSDDDETYIRAAPSGTENVTPLSALLSVSKSTAQGRHETAVQQLIKGPNARTTHDALRHAPLSNSGQIIPDSGMGPTLAAALAAIEERRTLWDDVLQCIDVIQQVALHDTDNTCRMYAAQIAASSVIEDLTVGPLKALSQLTKPHDK